MTVGLSILGIVLVLLYGVLIIVISFYWKPSPEVHLSSNMTTTSVSIIIAARNESRNITQLLDSILANNFDVSNLEILVVDDFSMDDTAEKVRNYPSSQVKLLSLAEVTDKGSKKQAIAYAASQAKGDIWMFTDADCTVPADWILRCVHRFDNDPDLMVLLGAVTYPQVSNMLEMWQQLDLMGMIAVTKAGVDRQQWFIGNGANLAILSQLWKRIGYPLDQVHKHASGDDVQLVQAAADLDSNSIKYDLHPDSIVTTTPQSTLSGLIQQRLRWTSKNSQQSGISQKLVMAFMFLFSLYFLVLFCCAFINHELWMEWIFLVVAKGVLDSLYLTIIQNHYPSQIKPWYMMLLSPIHTVYIAIFGILAIFPQKYAWKGRKVS